ncbi:hypothetical protein PoB_003139600 [Plakobranchus ocellatus]|uniref:Uncharacterized protein n=1 Tax=Plakobranchus ocellatus TaxID=259542 RepID=A0AAV4AE19_9GAST|nr:hypothetical protein PoB_003139600 [Plakobranchus ocellatus]
MVMSPSMTRRSQTLKSPLGQGISGKLERMTKMSLPQQGDLRLSGPPSGQGAGSGARTRDRRVPADLRADSQATVLPKPPVRRRKNECKTTRFRGYE